MAVDKMKCMALASALLAMTSGFALAQSNVALNKPGVFGGLHPNYAPTVDAKDGVQLTDGRFAPDDPVGIWVFKDAIGWRLNDAGEPFWFSIDLGESHAIDGVAIHTAAGRAGVHWPEAVYVLVSNDGENYTLAGEIVALSDKNALPPAEGYATHEFKASGLTASGRYVAFVPVAQPYFFIDEVEVFGAPAAASVSAGRAYTLPDFAEQYVRGKTIEKLIVRRYREDISDIDRLSRRIRDNQIQKAIVDDLKVVEAEVDGYEYVPDGEFRTLLPFGELGEKIFQRQASVWRGMGLNGCVVWVSNTWDLLPIVHLPTGSSAQPLKLRMMANEYRAALLNLSNATDAPQLVRVEIADLPAKMMSDDIAVHRVVWTDTRRGGPVTSALPLAERKGNAYEFEIPSGITQQVWFNVHSRHVGPGEHRLRIVVTSNNVTQEVPFELTVSSVRFPDRPTLSLGGWDDSNVPGGEYDINPQNLPAVLEHLQARYVDSPWATKTVFPAGSYNADGTLATKPDTAEFERWRKMWPDARNLCVFLHVDDTFDGSEMGTALFEKKIGEWARFWAGQVAASGVAAENVYLLLVDEPREPEMDVRVLAWAKPIKAAATGMKIWEDPIHEDITQANQEMLAICDVLCVKRMSPNSKRDTLHLQHFQKNGAALSFYACSGTPGAFTDPYAYFRLQAWACARYGATSSHFWAFSDGGGASSWNGYADMNSFVPYFLDKTSVTPAKQMEAIREGVQDYEYFVMLRNAIGSTKNDPAFAGRVKQAEALLSTAAERVEHVAESGLNSDWNAMIDRTVADTVRLELLDAIESLQK